MSASDILSLVSLVVAAFAFLVSLLTYVYTVALGPRLDILFGNDIALHYTVDDKLCLLSYFVFFNGGAQPGAIVKLSGTISSVGGGREVTLQWESFLEENDTTIGGQEWFKVDSSAFTLIVAGRGVGGTEKKRIFISTDEACILHPGNYVLELRGLVGPKLTRWCKAKVNLEISQDDVQYLQDKCKEDANRVYQKTLPMTIKEISKRSWISELLSPYSPTFTSQWRTLGSEAPTSTSSEVKPSTHES